MCTGIEAGSREESRFVHRTVAGAARVGWRVGATFRFPFNREGMNAFTSTNESHSMQAVGRTGAAYNSCHPASRRSPMSQIEELADRVERLLLRHEEVQRTNALLREQLAAVAHERDNLRSRLNAARSRIDVLLDRLPRDTRGRRRRQRERRRRRAEERRLKQVEVTILGQSYLLGCPDGGEKALMEAVAAVDREMSAIRDGGKVKARERIAVLAALNLAFALAERGEAPSAPARGDAERRFRDRSHAFDGRRGAVDQAPRHGPRRRRTTALNGPFFPGPRVE